MGVQNPREERTKQRVHAAAVPEAAERGLRKGLCFFFFNADVIGRYLTEGRREGSSRWKQVKERMFGVWDAEDVCRQRKEESKVGRGSGNWLM